MDAVECYCSFSPKKLTKLSSLKSKPKPKLSSTSGSSPRTPKSPNTTSGRKLSEQIQTVPSSLREEELREVFRRFDCDCDEKISAGELRSYFASVGEDMSYDDAAAIISHLDGDNDGLLDFRDFVRLMDGGHREEDLKAAFGIFEMEKGSGRITAESLQRVMGQLGDPKSYDECVDMIRVFDSDGKGEIGYDEFQQMMMA